MAANNMVLEMQAAAGRDQEDRNAARIAAARERAARQQAEQAAQDAQTEQTLTDDTVPAATPGAPQTGGTVGPITALRLMGRQAADGVSNLNDAAGAVAGDVGQGFRESHSAVIHGGIDAANGVIGLINDMGNELGRITNFDPRVTFIDPETGDFKLGFTMDPDAFRAALVENGVMEPEQAEQQGNISEIPQVAPEQSSVSGQAIEGITQFLTGFAAGGRALKAAGWTGQAAGQGINWTRSMVQGALADFAVFDAQEGRLFDLVGEHAPEAMQPLTDFMATNEDDPELVGRFKNALEGSILGVAADGLIYGARALHQARVAREALSSAEQGMAAADDAAAQAFERDIINLGDPNGPLIDVASFEPDRMQTRMVDQAMENLRSGERALDRVGQEHLLGAADRWAASVRRLQPEVASTLDEQIENARSRVVQGESDALLDIMEQARKPGEQAVSLTDWLRGQGGLQELSDELASLGGQRMRMRGGKPVSTNSGLEIINDEGLRLDRAAEMAAEAGYIGRRSMEGDLPGFEGGDVNELLDALRSEAGGDRVYSELDFDLVAADAARMDLLEEVEALGLNPDAPIAARRAQAERLASWEPGEPLTLRDFDDISSEMNAAGAARGIPAPGSGLLGGEEVRINFNALQAPDDIRSIIGQLADSFSSEVNAARRLGRSDEAVIAEGRALDAWNALANRRVGVPLSDAEVQAAQSLYIASGENIRRTIEAAAAQGSDEAHFAVRRAMQVHAAVQAEIAGAKADAARALRAWGVPASGTAESRRQLQGVLNEHGGRFSDKDLARLRALTDDPADLDRAVRYISATSAIATIGADILRFAWLSGPQTHIANMVGNTLTMVYDPLPRLLTGVKGRILGDANLERQIGSALAEYSGMMAGVRAQMSAFARSADYGRMGRMLSDIASAAPQRGLRGTLMDSAATIATENPIASTFRGRFDDRGVSGRKFDETGGNRGVSAERFGIQGDSATGKFLNGVGAVLSAPTEFLGFQDDFFKGVNELSTRYRMAYDQAMSELGDNADPALFGERMRHHIENPGQEMIEEARRTAQRRTFTEPVGEVTRSILTMRNALNRGGIPFGHVLLPFVVTPSNILKFAFQNSPVGFVFRELADDIKAGGERASIARSRISMGTGLLMLGMDYAANGMVTGRAPTDPAERQLLDRTGWQEYSVRVGDQWYSYRRMEPISTMLSIGADLHQITSRTWDGDPETAVEIEKAMGAAVGSMISAVTSKTYLTGISEFVQFTEDPERYGSSYISRLTSGVVIPTGLSQIERFFDPQIRDAQTMMDRVVSRTPGLSDSIPQQYDLWGRPRIFESGNGRVYDALAPWAARRIDAEPIDAELLRLNDFPGMPDRNVQARTTAGIEVAVDLRSNPAIYARYVQLAGNEAQIFPGRRGARDFLNAVVSGNDSLSASYERRSDFPLDRGSKSEFIERVISDARRHAREILKDEFRDELEIMADRQFEAIQRSEQLRLQQVTSQ